MSVEFTSYIIQPLQEQLNQLHQLLVDVKEDDTVDMSFCEKIIKRQIEDLKKLIIESEPEVRLAVVAKEQAMSMLHVKEVQLQNYRKYLDPRTRARAESLLIELQENQSCEQSSTKPSHQFDEIKGYVDTKKLKEELEQKYKVECTRSEFLVKQLTERRQKLARKQEIITNLYGNKDHKIKIITRLIKDFKAEIAQKEEDLAAINNIKNLEQYLEKELKETYHIMDDEYLTPIVPKISNSQIQRTQKSKKDNKEVQQMLPVQFTHAELQIQSQNYATSWPPIIFDK